MPTTRVTALTGHNVRALNEVQTEVGLESAGASYAVLSGTPEEALGRVQATMDRLLAQYGGRSWGYRSLIAVRNKLRKFVEDEPNSGKHVRVTDR